MQVETVESVLRLEVGTEIEAFKGRVKKVFTPKSGQGKKGRWSMQGIIVADGTREIGVTIWEGDELRRDWEGQVIYIEGNIKRDEYEGKAKLNVGEGSNITRAEGAASAPAQERPAAAPTRQHESSSADGVTDARAFLGRARNLAILCRKAAVSAGKECDAEDAANFFTPEQIQALTAMLFIAADKRGLIEVMPTGKMEAAKPAPARPAPAPVPVAPPPPIEAEGDNSDIPF